MMFCNLINCKKQLLLSLPRTPTSLLRLPRFAEQGRGKAGQAEQGRGRTGLYGVRGLLILFLISFSYPHYAEAGEGEWKLMGKTDNGKFLLYIDTKSISYGSENIFTIKAKKEVSREAFDETVRRAEKESGAKVEDPEGLYKIIIKSETTEYMYEIDCEKNELRNIPLKTSAINIVTVFPILPNSVEEKIKNEFCRNK